MIGDLTESQFDSLEIIGLLGGSVRRDEFAMRVGIAPDSATTRLQRLRQAGLVDSTPDPDDASPRKRGLYRVSADGERRFQAALASMDPHPEPVRIPTISRLIEIPALIAARVITMEAA